MGSTMSSSSGREEEEDGLTNVYIEKVLLPRCKYFRGVYSCNSIPEDIVHSQNFCIICNLSKLGEPGTHFVCIIVRPEYALYIDSFGMTCHEPNISHFLSRLNKPVFYNNRRVQDFSSRLCGGFCMLFVLFFERSETWRAKNKLKFNFHNLLQNDKTCMEYISCLLKE
jgi:hypothetical protein